MDYATIISLSSLTWLLIVIGLFLNTFIVAKNCSWWWKGQTRLTTDVIMTSLGTVRIFCLIFWMYHNVVQDAMFRITVNTFVNYIITAIIFTETCSLWWGTVLCVFYCVKITNYSNRLFMRLKMNISRMVPWLLLTSLLVSFLSSLPCGWVLNLLHYMNSTQYISGSNDGNIIVQLYSVNLTLFKLAGSFIPIIIFCTAISLLIASLLKHTRNMSMKDSGFKRPHLVAHIRAIVNMISFLFLYALFFIGSNLMPLAVQLQNPVFRHLCRVCCISYSSLHSIMLIVSNGNLKRSFVAALSCTRKVILK